jgi:hypothetical protein
MRLSFMLAPARWRVRVPAPDAVAQGSVTRLLQA